MKRKTLRKSLAMACLALSPAATGQSLFMSAGAQANAGVPGLATRGGPGSSLAAASLFHVAPPEPRAFGKHDIIYVIIDEQSTANSSQTLDTEKTLQADSTLNALLDLRELLTGDLRNGTDQPIRLLDIDGQSTFEGDGSYGRTDRIRARIAATVLDVKPNGTLVIEARKQMVTDAEERTILLSGVVRQEDVTVENTVLSSQLADLRVVMEHEGELRKAAKKRWLTKAIEFVLPF